MQPYSIPHVRRSLSHFLLGKGLGMFVGLALLLVLVRALDVADYGFYIASQALLEVIGQLSSFGLIVAAQRYLPELLSKKEGRKLFRLTILLCVGRIITLAIAVGLLFPLVDWIAGMLDMQDMIVPLQLFLIVILFENIARFLDVVFDSLLMQGVTQVSLLLRSFFRLVPMAWLLLEDGRGVPLTTWILIEVVAAMVGVLWGCYKLWKFLREMAIKNPGNHPVLDTRRYLSYSMPTFLAVSLYTISGINVVKLIALRILPEIQYASFGFAASFTAMMQRYLPMFLLIGMIRPLFIVARQRDDYTRRLPVLAGLVFKLNAFALMPAIAFLLVLHEPLADILTGGYYPEAGGYLLAFMLVLIVQALRGVVSLVAQAMENARAPLVGTLLGLFGLLFGVITSGVWGGYGLCFGLALSELLFAGWVLKSLRSNRMVIKVDWFGYAKLLIVTALSAAILSGTQSMMPLNSIVTLMASGVVVSISYLLLAFVLKPFSSEERSIVNRLLNRKIFLW